MITTITTELGIIEMPCPPPDDANSIMGLCSHGVSLFAGCDECEPREEPAGYHADCGPECGYIQKLRGL